MPVTLVDPPVAIGRSFRVFEGDRGEVNPLEAGLVEKSCGSGRVVWIGEGIACDLVCDLGSSLCG